MSVVGVAGATGALGKEILSVLDKAPWRPKTVHAFASARTTSPSVEYGDQHLSVDDLDAADLGALNALFLAVPAEAARDVGERAIQEGVGVIVDASGAFADDGDVPTVVPWVNPERLQELPTRGIVAIPHGPAILIASILGPLARAGLIGAVDVDVMLPASAFGRDGIDELSRQVVALFNAAAPPRKVFDQGLAFDLLPAVGELGADGVSAEERRAVAEVRRLLGDVDLTVNVVGTPVFSGVSAHLRLAIDADPAKIAQVLADGGAVVHAGARQIPRPRRVEGRPFTEVGRIRRDAHGIALWASLDNLRGAAAVAVGACGALLRKAGRG